LSTLKYIFSFQIYFLFSKRKNFLFIFLKKEKEIPKIFSQTIQRKNISDKKIFSDIFLKQEKNIQKIYFSFLSLFPFITPKIYSFVQLTSLF